MLPRLRSFFVFLMVAVAIQILPAVLHADNPQGLLEGKPAYTLAEARSYVSKIRPLVEKATGRKFSKVPTIVLANRDQMTSVLVSELKPQLANVYPKMSPEQLDLMCHNQAYALSRCLMGKYGIKGGKLYLLPKNLLPILNVAKVDDRHAESLLQLIIAHELTHALQDQKTDLRRAYKIMDADQLSAFSATIEGHAVWAQEVVGRQLGLNESVVEMSRLLSAGSVKYDDPALEMINKTIATQFEEVYLGGEKFISYHYQHGGNERVWQIIANPPLKTSMIALPETYSAKPQVELNYAKLFDGLENKLDDEGWEIRNIGLGHMAVKSVYAQMDEADQSQILAQVQHVQSFVAQNDTLESTFNISVVTMKDAKFAPTYLQLLEKMIKRNVDMLRASPSVQIKIFAITNFEPFPNDPSHKVLLNVFSGDGSDSSKQIYVRVFKDKLMLEFYLCNYDMNDAQITEIIEEILGRYQKLRKT